jgi:hypothetical protein
MAATHSTTESPGPRPVPDLDMPDGTPPRPNAMPMAPDFFTSSRAKPKKRAWKISR